MKQNWQKKIKYDPIPTLLENEYEALQYFVRRDLLNERVGSVEKLWELPGAERIIRRQQKNGSWKYPNPDAGVRSKTNYDLLETYRQVGFLVEFYGMTKKHPAIQKAAKFIFKFQLKSGEIRGIYGKQYSPNYSAAMMEELIKAGYQNDTRIKKGFRWLESVRQDDGGWAIALRTIGGNLAALQEIKTYEPDRSKPFSHLITGVVLRVYAADPKKRKSVIAKEVGELMMERMFERDKYVDRQTVEYWTKFSYPFWMTDILSTLDSLSLIGFNKDEPKIQEALKWFRDHQRKTGLFNAKLLKGSKTEQPYWITLAICRVFKRFYG